MAVQSTVQPGRPWRPTPAQIAKQIGLVVTAAVGALGLNMFTGLEGRLGFAFSFIMIAIAGSALLAFTERGFEAAKNAFVQTLIVIITLIVLIPIISIIWTLVENGLPALKPNFFTQDMSLAAPDSPFEEGGASHAIVGTLQLVLIASALSIPVGILTALYLTEIRGRFASLVRFLVQAMAGVPSIVAGLFVYSAWVLGPGGKYSGLAGGMALSILMLPTVARTAEEVLKLVPNDLREAGAALGGTQWRTVAGIVLPTARSGLVTSGILGVARVAGETAPLLLTIFGASVIIYNPFNEAIGALPLYIFTYLRLGLEPAIARAWTAALVLMLIVLALFTIARYLGGRKSS